MGIERMDAAAGEEDNNGWGIQRMGCERGGAPPGPGQWEERPSADADASIVTFKSVVL
jgi:hypothetical protein